MAKIKSLIGMMTFLAVAVIGITLGGEKAGAQTYAGEHHLYINPQTSHLFVSKDSANIYTSIEHTVTQFGDSIPIYFRMTLERYNAGSWDVVGTRTGYTATNSPSSRTFTNVGSPGSYMKVKVLWYRDSAMNNFCGLQEVKFYR